MSSALFSVVFPGQGSQCVGMLSELNKEQPIVKALFDKASAVLAYDLWDLVQNGPEEKLNETMVTQPAMLVADLAVFECWKLAEGPMPSFMAGHSLGEYAALVCAGALTDMDAVDLVAKRAHYMQQAVPLGLGAMGVVMGLQELEVEHLCREVSAQGEDQLVSIANLNAIGQTVVAGHTSAVEQVIQLALIQGAKVAKKIPVSIPSHCSLMNSAAERLANDIKKVAIKAPKIPIIHNVDVCVHHDPDLIRQALIDQLINPVRWVETIQHIIQELGGLLLESGPGHVLRGLNKRIDPAAKTWELDTMKKIQSAKTAIIT